MSYKAPADDYTTNFSPRPAVGKSTESGTTYNDALHQTERDNLVANNLSLRRSIVSLEDQCLDLLDHMRLAEEKGLTAYSGLAIKEHSRHFFKWALSLCDAFMRATNPNEARTQILTREDRNTYPVKNTPKTGHAMALEVDLLRQEQKDLQTRQRQLQELHACLSSNISPRRLILNRKFSLANQYKHYSVAQATQDMRKVGCTTDRDAHDIMEHIDAAHIFLRKTRFDILIINIEQGDKELPSQLAMIEKRLIDSIGGRIRDLYDDSSGLVSNDTLRVPILVEIYSQILNPTIPHSETPTISSETMNEVIAHINQGAYDDTIVWYCSNFGKALHAEAAFSAMGGLDFDAARARRNAMTRTANKDAATVFEVG